MTKHIIIHDDIVSKAPHPGDRLISEWYERQRPHICEWCRHGRYLNGRCEVCNDPEPDWFGSDSERSGIRLTGPNTLRPFFLAAAEEPSYESPARDPAEVQADPLPLVRAVLLRRLLARPEAP